MNRTLPCAFTVDLEDWYHGIELPVQRWPECTPRLEVGLRRVLELLQKYDVRGTFFTLGWIAERHPRLMREIAAAGHELGSHGYSHAKVYDLSPDEFRTEVRNTKNTLEQTTGQRVTAHRSPYFTITPRTLWALKVLAEEGYTLDCSINPVKTWRYGIHNSPDDIYHVSDCGITEFPVSTYPFLGRKWAIGGAYFRIAPLRSTAKAVERRVAAGKPTMFYVHPWEYDPDHPSMAMEWKARTTHYFRLSAMYARTERLLQRTRFDTATNVVEAHARTRSVTTIHSDVLSD